MPSNGKKRKTKAPVYSADTMAMRYVAGVLLVAFGVLVFFSVVMGIRGDVFAGTRSLAGGLAGSFAFMLPLPPVWGGILLILSAQRKTSIKPLFIVCLIMLAAMALMHLVSTTGNPSVPLMNHFLETNRSLYTAPGAFDAFLARGYDLGAKIGMGGGLLGMLIAWPMWVLAGLVPAIVILVLAFVLLALLLFKMNPKRLFHFSGSQNDSNNAFYSQDSMEQQAEDLAWQQQQAAQRRARTHAPAQQYPSYAGYNRPSYRPSYQNPPLDAQATSYSQQQIAPSVPDQKTTQSVIPGFQSYGQETYQLVKPNLYVENVSDTLSPMAETPPVPEIQPSRSSRLFSRLKKTNPETQEKKPAAPPDTKPYATADEFRRLHGGGYHPVSRPAAIPPPVPPIPDEWEEVQVDEETRSFMNEVTFEALDDAIDRSTDPASYTQQVSAPESVWTSADDQSVHRTYQSTRVAATSPASDISFSHAVPPASYPSNDEQRSPRGKHDYPTTSSTSSAPPVRKDITTASVPYAIPQVQSTPPTYTWQPELKLPEPEKKQEAPVEAEEKPYVYPHMSLLKTPAPPSQIAAEEDAFRARRLEETLQSFKIPAQVRHITHGPSISRFELEIASGIKVSKVTDLDRNLAMNMEVKSVRIEAPIPGKSLVGVEVPNRKVTPVTLREVLETDEMRSSHSPLTVALGKDIAGQPILCDLARMPHLLIAGATGSGKSVCVNAMINSLLYRCSPKEVRLILVDPKVVELQCYNGIPHLLVPVVSDPHKAAGALEWAVTEMMDRYKKFQLAGVREINGYNQGLSPEEEKMPRIVIVIDELADLMMTCKKDVEERICRLAQLARAAGIHLVVATQRPSVDIITGLIKANIPSRIAFKVSSFIDSRTIMDRPGAEKLLGYGDMLYLPNGEFTPTRIQGCFLTDSEVNSITDFIRSNSTSSYDPIIMEQLDRLEKDASGDIPLPDEESKDSSLLAQVIEMTVQEGQISASLIQRRFSVGYARAGRLVDEMEKRGIVSQKDGAKPRMCLISREELYEMERSGALNISL